uniref:Uncharacterized protein n=1 Tax=Opuntia streptacantha TaxID=393608 RepID=A0A7C9AGF2_OPUST
MGGGRGELSPGGDPDQHGPTKTTAALASHPPRAQLLGAVGGAGHRGVPAQQRHLHVHPNLLRPPRKSRACRRLPRQQRGPALGLWPHARDGERSGDVMWASVRGSQVRDARNLPPTIDDPPSGHRNSTNDRVCVLQGHPHPSRGVQGDSLSRGPIHIWVDPTDLCVCVQLPHTEVPPGPECGVSECLHLGSHPGGPPRAHLGSGVQAGAGSPWGLLGAQLLLVDHSHRPICVHRDE